MALLKIVNTSNMSFVAFKTELTAKDIKTALIADPKSLGIYNKDGIKEFEFDLAPEGGITALSNRGVLVLAPKDDAAPITHMFEVEDEDREAVMYVAAIVTDMMNKIEVQVKEAVKKVRSVKVQVENL
jgi:predicted RNA-binding protein Jag